MKNLYRTYLSLYEDKDISTFNEMGIIKEEVNCDTIVIMHILNEGFANNIESAEAIFEVMSEEWINSILEEYKKLPRFKMASKIAKLGLDSISHGKSMGKAGLETTEGQIENYKLNKKAERAGNIAGTLTGHDEKKVKSKKAQNIKKGEVKKRVQKLLKIDQNRRNLPVQRMRSQTDRLFDKGHMERSMNVDDMRMSRAQRYMRGYRNPEIGRFKPKDDD